MHGNRPKGRRTVSAEAQVRSVREFTGVSTADSSAPAVTHFRLLRRTMMPDPALTPHEREAIPGSSGMPA